MLTPSLFDFLVFGFILGMKHATDADHVAAIATIVSRQKDLRGAAWTGLAWGLGHSLAMMGIGGAIVLFRLVVPARLGLSLEFSVAVMLIVLGLWNIAAIVGRTRAVLHRQEENQAAQPVAMEVIGGRPWNLRCLLIGAIHGLAGSAGITLLTLPFISNPAWAMGYLAVYGVGTITGMMLITGCIALPFLYTGARFKIINRWMGAATGALSLAFGLFLAYQIAVVGGLFRS